VRSEEITNFVIPEAVQRLSGWYP